MADIKAIAEELVNLTVKEVNELATILKEEYGIEPAAAAVAVAGPAAGGAAAAEEKLTRLLITWDIRKSFIRIDFIDSDSERTQSRRTVLLRGRAKKRRAAFLRT